jgi:hypothetical protein
MRMKALARTFQFVNYGSSFLDDDVYRPTISCDGRVPGGVSLELTHWTDNETPDKYYADTSTEMALKLPPDEYTDAIVLNNHYDTDGVLSVFACLQPDLARKYAGLLKEGAEAGDFGEWSSDLGIKLDAIVSGMCEDDEEEAYHHVLEQVPDILKDLATTGGEKYGELWKATLDDAYSSYLALQDGSATFEAGPEPHTAILMEPSRLSCFAVHRGLTEKGLLEETTRILRVTNSQDGSSDSTPSSYSYQYEKPGHGWVQKLVDRKCVPSVNSAKLVEQLNSVDWMSCNWKSGGASGLVSICFAKFIQATPHKVAARLAQLEAALST